MRRERSRQTGSTRTQGLTKMDRALPFSSDGRPGPFPWDRFQQAPRKPSDRELRRSFGAQTTLQQRKG